MEIKPMETAPKPGYPDKYAAEARLALAQAHPNRWLRRPLIVGVLSATVALGLSGCDDSLIGGPPAVLGMMTALPPIETGADGTNLGDDFITMGDFPIPVLSGSYIPVFEYGEGTGSIGCMAIAAPVFMSEEEAFAILAAALAEAGLTLNKAATTLDMATLPVTDLYGDKNIDTSAVMPGALTIDGLLDVEQGLPVKFVSKDDIEAWQYKHAPGETPMMSSVSSYKVQNAARTLADNNPSLVVFYDPLTMVYYDQLWDKVLKAEGESEEEYWARWEAARDEAEQAAKAESGQYLRGQAQALVDWLRAQGVL